MGLPIRFYLTPDSKCREPILSWLKHTRDHGIGSGDELMDRLPTGHAWFPADVDSLLRAMEDEGWIERVKWCPSFSRRAFLSLEGRGAAKGTAYQYAFDFTWHVLQMPDELGILICVTHGSR